MGGWRFGGIGRGMVNDRKTGKRWTGRLKGKNNEGER